MNNQQNSIPKIVEVVRIGTPKESFKAQRLWRGTVGRRGVKELFETREIYLVLDTKRKRKEAYLVKNG